uniref:Secreted protein n=1 Tax=Arundo donax TaxID=35708 RepID=A0A0A9FRW3_ARUDO
MMAMRAELLVGMLALPAIADATLFFFLPSSNSKQDTWIGEEIAGGGGQRLIRRVRDLDWTLRITPRSIGEKRNPERDQSKRLVPRRGWIARSNIAPICFPTDYLRVESSTFLPFLSAAFL